MPSHLVIAAALLPAANVVHALAPAVDGQPEAIAGPVMGTVVTISAVVALIGLLRDRPWAPVLALASGLATIAGFALFHAIPVQSDVTEPYWGHHGATNAAQVTTLVVIAAAAIWLVVEATLALRSSGDTA
jgi:hypothetical protein